jgi:hypothetical protein
MLRESTRLRIPELVPKNRLLGAEHPFSAQLVTATYRKTETDRQHWIGTLVNQEG